MKSLWRLDNSPIAAIPMLLTLAIGEPGKWTVMKL
jgi:hypothetical protein